MRGSVRSWLEGVRAGQDCPRLGEGAEMAQPSILHKLVMPGLERGCGETGRLLQVSLRHLLKRLQRVLQLTTLTQLMRGNFGDVCGKLEDEANLFVNELSNKESGLHRDTSDGEGVCQNRQYTSAPDSELAGEGEGSVS